MMTTEDPTAAPQPTDAPTPIWTISGKHPTTGRAIACSNGSWSGDKALRQAAHTLCEAGTLLPLGPYGPMVAADASDPLATTAVIAALTMGKIDGDIPWDRIAAATGAEEE